MAVELFIAASVCTRVHIGDCVHVEDNFRLYQLRAYRLLALDSIEFPLYFNQLYGGPCIARPIEGPGGRGGASPCKYVGRYNR